MAFDPLVVVTADGESERERKSKISSELNK